MKKLILLLCLVTSFSVSANTGSIDLTATNTAKLCYDPTCTTPAPDTINFELIGQPSITVDSVTGISGYIWGNTLGWINMHPTGGGVTFADTTTGVLTGKAWSQVSGWINFAVTGQQVLIDPANGEFSGFAWTGGPSGGWIKFDCGADFACVKTAWRNKGTTGSYPSIDVCKNIAGSQTSIPSGYTVGADGACIPAIDACPNIAGDQAVIPPGFTRDTIGACIAIVDYCPNIAGLQVTLPPFNIINIKGNCSLPEKDDDKAEDVCPNVIGVQASVPEGYVEEQGLCYPVVLDLCKNVEGSQYTIPEGDTLDSKGNCVEAPVDLCPNLSGSQSVVPKGFHKEQELCLFDDPSSTIYESTVPVVSYSFIPESLRITSNNRILKSIVGALTGQTGEFRVDLVSTGGSVVLSIGLILFVLRLVRKFLP